MSASGEKIERNWRMTDLQRLVLLLLVAFAEAPLLLLWLVGVD